MFPLTKLLKDRKKNVVLQLIPLQRKYNVEKKLTADLLQNWNQKFQVITDYEKEEQ